MKKENLFINQKWLCKEDYIMDSKKVGFKKGNTYSIDSIKVGIEKILMTFKSEIFEEHLMYFDNEFKEHFELVDKTYQLSERQKNELIKEPNIKDFFIREGIIDETIEIKKSVILNTPNDLELGQLIRKMV